MDPTRELTSVDIRAIVRELGSYRGATVEKAYRYDDGLVRLRCRGREHGRVELLIEVGESKRLNAADPETVPDAPERPPDFARKLRGRIGGAALTDVRQYGFDRIVELEFSRDDGTTTIVAELFGDGNVSVLDANGAVVACLEVVRLSSRTVAPGAHYDFPSARLDPLELSEAAFVARVRESDTDLVRTLATQLNFGGLWGEELCTRAGVEKTRDVAEATEGEIEALYEAVSALAEALAAGQFDPRVYFEDDRPVDVAPFPLEERSSLRAEPYESVNAAVDAYFRELEAVRQEPDRPDFEAEIAKQQRIIEQQAGAIEDFEAEAEALRGAAEALYARYDVVDELLSTVREAREAHSWAAIEDRLSTGADRGVTAATLVAGVNPESGTIAVELDGTTVDLDPSMGVEKNADRLYGDAKAIEEKRAGAEEALAETRATLERLEAERDDWTADADADEGGGSGSGAAERTAAEWLAMDSIPVRAEEQWYERFRWFHTSDGFLVLGGRDADDNEALVKKYLEPGDRFFHAQAHGAPVTILKATGPSERSREVDFPEATLEEAAQFAVSYASVWKSGRFAGDVYMVGPDQVSKTPESGEYLEKGSFAIRGDRTYFEDTAVGCAVGIQCAPETRVIGGPPAPIEATAATAVRVEPGEVAQGDVAKRIYRRFRERFADTGFVRKVASPDAIAEFLPPGGSRIVEE